MKSTIVRTSNAVSGGAVLRSIPRKGSLVGLPSSDEMYLAFFEQAPFGFVIALPGCDLQLMPAVKDVGDLPTAGKRLIIVADVGQVLYFRIFDGDGVIVMDTDSRGLKEHARPIEDLREHLESLWPPHKLTERERIRVILRSDVHRRSHPPHRREVRCRQPSFCGHPWIHNRRDPQIRMA